MCGIAGFWTRGGLDESARAPLIVAAPGKKAGAVSPRVVEFVDIYPTLTTLCGLKTPAGMEGASLVPLLEDPSAPGKRAVFTVVRRQGGLGRAVRTEAHTYILWPNGSEQLYDPVKDPKEYVNLAKNAQAAGTLAEMRQVLKDWKAAHPDAK